MPFTAAHPALVLPLVGRFPVPYATSALIIGAMSPDFEYFIRLRPLATVSHSILGVVVFCLPLGLLVLAAYHLVVKRPVALLLPDWVRSRLSAAMAPKQVRVRHIGVLAVLIMVGAASHLAWDSFTHGGGLAVQRWPALSVVVFRRWGLNIAVFNALQHTSSFIGLIALAWAGARWLGRQPACDSAGGLPSRQRWQFVVAIMATAVATGVLVAAVGSPATLGVRAMHIALVRFIVATIAGMAVAVFAYGLATTLKQRA